MKPLACFKIRVNRGKLYVRVYVWRTLKELRAYRYRSRVGVVRPASVSTGCCMQHTWGFGNPHVADVHLSAKRLGVEIVAHEFFHATIHWLSRLRKPLAMFYDAKRLKTKAEWDNEEIGAEMMEELVRNFYRTACDKGLWSNR